MTYKAKTLGSSLYQVQLPSSGDLHFQSVTSFDGCTAHAGATHSMEGLCRARMAKVIVR